MQNLAVAFDVDSIVEVALISNDLVKRGRLPNITISIGSTPLRSDLAQS
jgi:hypothetical protein